MSLSEEDGLLLSQLIDGELPVDQTRHVPADVLNELARVLGDAEAAGPLGAMLRLRQTLDPWRRQELPKPVVPLSSPHRVGRAPHFSGLALSLAAAALLGGILATGGFWLGGRSGIERSILPVAEQPVVVVTPEERHEIARVFALHESVAGPLSWFAADDSTIQVGPAGKDDLLRPRLCWIAGTRWWARPGKTTYCGSRLRLSCD